MKTTTKKSQETVKASISEAKAMLGHGWAHVSLEIQVGLVSAAVLAKLAARIDEETTSAEAARCGYAVDEVWSLVVGASQNGWRLDGVA